MDILRDVERLDEAALQRMSYDELVALEDELLLKNELSTVLRIRFTAGRVVLLLLGGVLWLVFFLIAVLLTRSMQEDLRGLVSAAAVFVSLGLAVFAAQRVWSAAGTPVRMLFRYALHYWPVLVVLGGSVLVGLSLPPG